MEADVSIPPVIDEHSGVDPSGTGGGGRRFGLRRRDMGGARCILALSVVVWMLLGAAAGNVVLYGPSVSLSFSDIESNLGPSVRKTGECGRLYLADPPDACSHLVNEVNDDQNSSFALIIRGECMFDEKVRNAQKAGFKAAIIYDDVDYRPMTKMEGNSSGINIPAVFVSKASGEVMKMYAGISDIDVWILAEVHDSLWLDVAMAFLFIISLSACSAMVCFVRTHHVTRQHTRIPQVKSLNGGMSEQLVKALPTLLFTEPPNDCCTSMTCAFCLDDYKTGDKLRVLPCQHRFHAACVDSWLTLWRTFCPMCKRDVRTNIEEPPATESTPLLSPVHISVVPTDTSASFRSSAMSSSAIEIVHSLSPSPLMSRAPSPSPVYSPIMSRTHSISSTTRTLIQVRSYNNLQAANINRSLADVWNLSSQGSHVSYFLSSSHSLGHGLPLSINSRSASPCGHYFANGSPSYMMSTSSRHSYLRHNGSATSLSAFASSHSLAEV